jgi:hypothetical protein
MTRTLLLLAAVSAAMLAGIATASAQACKQEGSIVTCDDGRQGVLSDTTIVWTDGTRSHSATPHPSIIIGNKASVHIGQGVFYGTGKAGSTMPLDNPNAPNKTRCAVVNGVSYC